MAKYYLNREHNYLQVEKGQINDFTVLLRKHSIPFKLEGHPHDDKNVVGAFSGQFIRFEKKQYMAIKKLLADNISIDIEKKKYTVGTRFEFRDGHDWIKVEAVNAFEALKEAKRLYKKDCDKEDKTRTIYTEYIMEGHVNCIYNEYGWGASTKQLKAM